MFVERKTRIDLRNRGSETGRDLPGAHRVLGSYGTLGDKVCVCVWGGVCGTLESQQSVHCVTWVSDTLSVPCWE